MQQARSIAVVLLLLKAPSASAQECQAVKNDVSGKYAACMAKAEKGFVLKKDAARYAAAQGKCEGKYAALWAKAEAVGYCPSVGDQSSIQGFVDACVQSVADALGGLQLPKDAVTCNAELGTCTTNLGTCPTDLGACAAGLGACQNDCVASVRPPLRTGEMTSYGAGSDGDLRAGAARSFTDNGDGTITDNTTGLTWEKKDDAGAIHDKDNVYTWSTGTNEMDGTIVTTFLAMLNGGGGFAGHTDWRVPNVSELETLRNLEAANPSTYAAFNTGCVPACTVLTCSCMLSYSYYSSSTDHDLPTHAWLVMFSNGSPIQSYKTLPGFVRAVRAGS